MNQDVLKKVELWKNSPIDKNLREELLSMDENSLMDAFGDDISFGTAGLRGIIGVGTNRMNVHIVEKTTLGFYNYMVKKYPDAHERGVVIAYDCRRMSKEFSLAASKVLTTHGMKVYLFSSLRPTPELSFAVRYLKCAGGIMITASHNPPQYNGYKVYDDKGCQLIPELADLVTKEVNNVKDMFNTLGNKDAELKIIDKEVDDEYIKMVKTIEVRKDTKKDNIKVVYTPLHGTGCTHMVRLLNEAGYPHIYPVSEQMIPDGEFSTLRSPNPEESSAFEYALTLGKLVDADILIATDPDADRMGIAALNDNHEYVLLTGNQTGAILLNYLALNKEHDKSSYVFNTIVTSNIAKAICDKQNLTLVQTLTGFKYIGEQAELLEGTNKKFFFGYEESYGCVVAPFVRDKDSFQATLLLCEVASYYKEQGKTLVNVLDEIYKEYGYYLEGVQNISLTGLEGAKKIKRIMDTFANLNLKKVAGKDIVTFENYELSKSITNGKESLITLPKASVLRYIFDDGAYFALRPSGTEPKLKIYIAIVGKDKEDAQSFIEKVKEELMDIVNSVK